MSLSGRRLSLMLFAGLSLCGQILDLASLSRARDAAAANRQLADAERQQILEFYDTALRSLRDAVKFRSALLAQERRKAALQREIRALEQEVAAPPLPATPPAADESSQAVEDALGVALSERNSRSRALADLAQGSLEIAKRANEILARRAQLLEEQQSVDDQLEAIRLQSSSTAWEAAGRAQADARKLAIQTELDLLAREREALDIARSMLPLRRDAAKLRLEAAGRAIEALRARSVAARARDGSRALQRNRAVAEAAASLSPALRSAAEETEGLSRQLWGAGGVIATRREVADLTERFRQRALQVQGLSAAMQRRYDAAGRFAPATEWLQALPPDLPRAPEVESRRKERLETAAAIRRTIVSLEEDRQAEASVETQLEGLRSGLAASAGAGADDKVRQLLQLRRTLREDLLKACQELETQLGEFDRASEDLLTALAAMRDFAWRRVFWARSAGGAPSLATLGGGLAWLFANPDWRSVESALASRPIALLLALAACVAIWLRLRRTPLPPPAYAAMAAGMLLFAGWLLAGGGTVYARATGAGLRTSGVLLGFLALLRQAARLEGGRFSLGFAPWLCQRIERELRWAVWALPAAWFVVAALAEAGHPGAVDSLVQTYHNALGRVVFAAAAAALLAAALRALRPASPAELPDETARDAFASQSTRYRWAVSAVLGALLALAGAGFYTTAMVLARNLFWTLAILAALRACGILLRAWRDAWKTLAPVDARAPEITERQFREFTRFARYSLGALLLLVAWSDVFPALSMLDEVEIYSSASSAGPAPSATPGSPGLAAMAVPAPTPATQPLGNGRVSLLALVQVLAAVAVAAILVKNLPGLTEVLLRNRLHAGSVYAVATVARYLVILAGAAISSRLLGIQWSQIQWLAAALTFGIGFGLQDIFANLASGLILLLDRSIRVGDAISVGELSGRVSRIQMRATTVTLWDRSEMIVPNKEFVSSKLINWTLSLPESRVDIKVGVPYDADLDRVRAVLAGVAAAHPNVLANPRPEILLVAFGDSAVLFELRAFCLFEYGRLLLRDELHTAIYREFAENGIAMASPRLDVLVLPSPRGDGPGPASATE